MNICIKCNKEHDGSFGSGKYCSVNCANSRTLTKEQKLKISNTLKSNEIFKKQEYECIICKNKYLGYNRFKKCVNCRKKVLHSKNIHDIKNFNELSKRTISKILKRANVKCALCEWNTASCDIHHIINKAHGGLDSPDNLIIICPNCHRSIHVLGEKFIKNEELFKKSIKYTFENWKDFYHPSN